MKAVGFLDGRFAIRYDEDFFVFSTSNYLPKVKKEIDRIIEFSDNFQISKIIFNALKIVFETNKIFYQPDSKTYVPKNDPLYNELVNYVQNNEIYQTKLNNCIKNNQYIKQQKENYSKHNNEYFEYKKSLREKEVKILRKKGLKVFY